MRKVTLAAELGLPRAYGVGNKARLHEDAVFFVDTCAEFGGALAGVVPFDAAVTRDDWAGCRLAAGDGRPVRAAVDGLVSFVADVMAAPVPVSVAPTAAAAGVWLLSAR